MFQSFEYESKVNGKTRFVSSDIWFWMDTVWNFSYAFFMSVIRQNIESMKDIRNCKVIARPAPNVRVSEHNCFAKRLFSCPNLLIPLFHQEPCGDNFKYYLFSVGCAQHINLPLKFGRWKRLFRLRPVDTGRVG